MRRRGFLRVLLSMSPGVVGLGVLWRERSFAAQMGQWNLRRVAIGDVDQLMALMRSCVDGVAAFHGECSPLEWSTSWAEQVVSQRPKSIVITLDDEVVAYFDLPTKPPRTVGDERIDVHRRAFWCGAAGVRVDRLGRDVASEVFEHLLREAFKDALNSGYESVHAAAPWDRHPYLPRPFGEYPGMEIEPLTGEGDRKKFLLKWRLSNAIDSLSPMRGMS